MIKDNKYILQINIIHNKETYSKGDEISISDTVNPELLYLINTNEALPLSSFTKSSDTKDTNTKSKEK